MAATRVPGALDEAETLTAYAAQTVVIVGGPSGGPLMGALLLNAQVYVARLGAPSESSVAVIGAVA